MRAMEELLNEYSYEQISVAMITQRVPIARQGFYKFYKNKEDLSRQMFLYYTDRAAIMEHDFTLEEFILHDLTEIDRHFVLFHKLALQSYRNDLFEILHENIFQIYTRMIRYHLKTNLSDDLVFLLDSYCNGGLLGLISLLRAGNSLDPPHLTRLYIDLMPQPVKELLAEGVYPADIIKREL